MKKNENIFDKGLIEALGEFASVRQEMIHDVEYALKLAGNKNGIRQANQPSQALL